MYNLFSKKANLKKNILSICSAIMLLLFLVAALPAQVYAQFAGGAGTSEDPYRIETAVHLNNVRDHLDAYFVLENDIDLDEAPYNEGEGWEPIGTEADRFTGNFDGQGYVIENLFIDRPNTDYVGLFGYVEWGEVENVGLENVNVTGEVQVGGLVGRNLYGNVSNSYATGDVTGNEHVGGLVGLHIAFNILHQVSNSYAAVDVTGEDVVGGLVGTIQGPDGNLTTSTVSNSYATGDVTGNRFVGGLIGRIIVGWVSNSYATGNVMRTSGESTSLGGFIGEILESRIRHCYSTGSVIFEEADDPTDRGFVGVEDGDNIYANNFFDSDASNQNTDAVGAADPKTTAEMKRIITFTNWDIAPTDTELNDGYPFLAWQDDRDDVAWLITGEELFCGGTGIENDPYLICTADELNNVRLRLDAYFRLENDIGLGVEPYNESEGWEPIGTTAARFTGSFDGDGHKISGLFINRPNTDYVGLFGLVDGGEVKNVGLENVNVTGEESVGGLVGSNPKGTVSNSYVTGDVSGVNVVGGLVGYNVEGTVSNSYATVDVSGVNVVGGLVGDNRDSTVSNSYATGEVTGERNVGGLVGRNNDGATVSNSYASVDVTGEDFVGGLVGDNRDGTVSNSYATGNVTRTSGTDRRFGGFVGNNVRSTIEYSFSTGSVFFEGADDPTDKGFVGGIEGDNTYTNNYFDSDASNQETDAVGAAAPKTTTEMKDIATFSADWDIAQSDTELNDGYPFLAWQLEGGSDESAWLIFEEPPLFCGGEGTETDPYLICTADQLNNVRDYMSDYFKLNNDIDLDEAPYNEGEGWEPIGDNADRFSGSFDGNGHKISGLFINRPNTDYVGLFGYVESGEVKNVGLENISVTGKDDVGGLIGQNIVATVSNSWSTGTVIGMNRVGGLVGDSYSGTVSNSYATGDVNGEGIVGGLVGRNEVGTVSNSYSAGDVTGNNSVGGLIGANFQGIVSNSYSLTDVSANYSAGGLVGFNQEGTVSNSYTTGNVTRTSGESTILGGFIGYNRDATIEYSYSTASVFYEGTVNPTDKGFVGIEFGTNTYTNNYFDSDASNQETDAVGAADPKTTTEMKDIATFFNNWDIAITDTELNDGYPFLAWQDDRDDVVWLITGEELFCGGEGTEADPYLICTADELNNVRLHLDAYFKLNNDIDLDVAPYNEGEGWEPIGNSTTPYTGQLDGAGFNISNLTINRPSEDDVGLFGYTESGARVVNLDMVDVNVSGNRNVGALAGDARDGLRVEDVSITGEVVAEGSRAGCLSGRLRSDSHVEDTFVACTLTSNDTGNVRIGGFAGELEDDGVIINSHSAAIVISVNNGGYVGGFIGEMEENAQIIGSHFSGSVSGGQQVGGLAGQAQQDNLIKDSWSTGTVNGVDEVGGLVGDLSGTSSIIASYSTGDVTASGDCVGGLAGLVRRNSAVVESYSLSKVTGGEYAGGLVGCARDDATIGATYASGEVSGSGDTGGLLALLLDNAAVANSFYDRNTSGQQDDDGRGVPKTTAEMKSITTFTDTATEGLDDPWDFTNLWAIESGDYISYPYFGNSDEAPIQEPPPGLVKVAGFDEDPRLFVTADKETPVTTGHVLFGEGESITITQLPVQGSLLLDGAPVENNDVIHKSDVEAGKLVYGFSNGIPSSAYVYGFDQFIYENSEQQRTLPIDLAAQTMPYGFSEGWFLFSSPGVNQTVGELLGNIRTEGYPGSTNPGASFPTVYTLDQENYQWAAVTGSDQVLVQGAGLLVYVFEEDTPAEELLFSEGPWAPLDGSFTYDDLLWYDPDQGPQGNSHFLIGNPHPVAIHICNMLFEGTNMATSIDAWIPEENDGHGGYVNLSCEILGSKATASHPQAEANETTIGFDGWVPPFIGFWVRTMDDNPSLAITEYDYRSSQSKQNEAKHEPVTLVLSHDERNYSNTVNILFTDRGTEGLDEIDAIKLSPAGLAQRYLSFYAMDDENRKYALRSLPTLTGEEVTIPLGIETTEQGSYTLSWSLPADGFAGANVYLRDHHTGITTQLRDGQTYRFEMEESMVAKDTNSPLERGSNDACGDAGVCPWMSASNATANAQAPRFELIITFDELKDGSSELPAEIVLRQNYPNPFNPATIITYELPQQVHVRLDVFDMTGRHVAELVNEQVSAGTHHVSFNAMNLSSGVYMYRLQAGGRVLSRQLTLIK